MEAPFPRAPEIGEYAEDLCDWFQLRPHLRLAEEPVSATWDDAKAAWALCAGAEFINTARGFMFALGCIQALRCHTNTCPTGVTTHNKRLQRGLVVEEKYLRVANYVRNMNREIDKIAHSCGLKHAREFRREHLRIVRTRRARPEHGSRLRHGPGLPAP